MSKRKIFSFKNVFSKAFQAVRTQLWPQKFLKKFLEVLFGYSAKFC